MVRFEPYFYENDVLIDSIWLMPQVKCTNGSMAQRTEMQGVPVEG